MALPSVDEAFGVAYVEALACGVPAIGCAGEGGPEEIAALGEGMLLVPPRDPDALRRRDPSARSPTRRCRAGRTRHRRASTSPGSAAARRRSPPTSGRWPGRVKPVCAGDRRGRRTTGASRSGMLDEAEGVEVIAWDEDAGAARGRPQVASGRYRAVIAASAGGSRCPASYLAARRAGASRSCSGRRSGRTRARRHTRSPTSPPPPLPARRRGRHLRPPRQRVRGAPARPARQRVRGAAGGDAEEFGKEISPSCAAARSTPARRASGFLAAVRRAAWSARRASTCCSTPGAARTSAEGRAGARRRGAAARRRGAGGGRRAALGFVPRDELPALYAAADALVLPSIRTATFLEPWGLVVNEAMHQGTPVIASDAVGAAAGGLVRDGRNGLVVAAGRRRGARRQDRALWPQIRSCERVSGPRHARTSPRSHTLPGSRGCGRHLSPWVRFVRDDLASLVIERPVRAHFFESAAHSQRPVQQLWDCWAGEPQS